MSHYVHVDRVFYITPISVQEVIQQVYETINIDNLGRIQPSTLSEP